MTQLAARGNAGRPVMPVGAVLLAACCWGALGTSYELILDRFPTHPVTVVTIRATTAALVLLIWILARPMTRRQLGALAVPRTAVLVIFGGLVSTAVFYIALIYAYREAGVAVATVLLYLGPTLVVLGSRAFFGSRISRAQWIALTLTTTGIVGVSGLLNGTDTFTVLGVGLGIASAFCYASYSLVGRTLLNDLSPPVVVTAVLTVGAICLWVVNVAVNGAQLPSAAGIVAIAAVNGVVTTLAPMLLYTWGLSRIGPSQASILATLEPVIGIVLAYLVLGERLTPAQLTGTSLVILSVVLAAAASSRA